jgi:amino acid transporter
MEKEARLVLTQMTSKLSAHEKLIGVGAIVAIVGFIVGLVLTSVSYSIVSLSWYSASGAEGVGFIALIAAIAAGVIVYLKNAPNTNIKWPAPVATILLVVAGVGAIAGLLGLFEAFTFGGGYGSVLDKPVMLYVAAGLVLVGCAIQAYAAYMMYTAESKPAA